MVALEQDDLATFTTKFYTIHTNLTKKEATPYGRHMDKVFLQYSNRFSAFRKRDRRSMPLYLVKTRRDYISLLSGFGINGSASGGMFFVSRKAQGLATWVVDENRSFTHTVEVLQHEGFHQFAHAYIGHNLPVWVNEGLAEYFEDGLFVGRKMKLGLANERRVKTIREAVKESTAIDFDDLLDITGRQWHDNMLNGSELGYLQYQQSWSIVYFLIHGQNGRYQQAFTRYLMLVSQGRHSSKAFRQAFKTKDTAAFRQRWEAFVQDMKPDPFSTAVGRMRFLGRGLRYLHDNHVKPIPSSIDELRQSLREAGFRLVGTSHGVETVKSAKDESYYKFRRDNGAQGQFEMLESEASNLLPRIVARGLRPEPMLVWSRGEDGKLESSFRYK